MGETEQNKNSGVRTQVLHRSLSEMPMARHSVGSRVYTHPGSYIDLSAGAGVLCLGSSNGPIKDAMRAQLYELPYVHAGQFTSHPVEDFAEELVMRSEMDGASVMFLNTGAEAVEAACKIAMQYHAEQGLRKPPQFFARQHSYHGNSMFCLQLGDHPRKNDWGLMLPSLWVERLPSFRQHTRDDDKYHEKLEAALTTWAERHDYPAIVVIETIGGTTLGIEPPTTEYLLDIRRLCTKYGAILIYDEVLCGNYRTGRMFAWQHYNRYTQKSLAPDILVAGKGLTAGYFPLSAVIVSKHIVDVMRAGSGRLWHSTTNQNHPIGCATGLAAMYQYDNNVEHVALIAKTMIERRDELLAAPGVTSLTGVGALWGLHFEPNEIGFHRRIKDALFQEGVSCYADGGTIDGKGNHILIAPPYTTPIPLLNTAIGAIIGALNSL